MSAFAWAAQKAIYNVLHNAGIAGGRIFDAAPQSVVYPWIEIGDRQIIPDDTSSVSGGGDDGVSDNFDLHLWSRYAGDKEIDEIFDTIHGLLHGVNLNITGRGALSWIRGVRIILDPDAITRHGVISVEIVHRT